MRHSPRGSSSTISWRTRSAKRALRASVGSSSRRLQRANTGSAPGFGTSRSAALQTMPLNSWPNSTAGPSTRRCTTRLGGAGGVKHTSRGRQPAPMNTCSTRQLTPTINSVAWRSAPGSTVVLALKEIAQGAGLDWEQIGAAVERDGRRHLETY